MNITLTIVSLFSTLIAYGQVGKVYSFSDDRSGKLNEGYYYGEPISYGSKPVFVVIDKKIAVLPLLTLEAKKEGNIVQLNWKATGSVDVERSNDGVKFTAIGKNVAANNTIDRYPYQGLNFYRIKQGLMYSEIRKVEFKSEEWLAVFTVIGEYLGTTNNIKTFLTTLPRFRYYLIVGNGTTTRVLNK